LRSSKYHFIFGFRKDIMTKNSTCGILIFLLALTILFVAIKENNDSYQVEGGLEIVESEDALGPVDDVNNASIEAYTYDFALYNGGNEEVYLDSVEPLFRKDLSARIITEDHKIVGNKTMKPHSTTHVKGQAEFNVSGLSEKQNLTLDHIYSVNVTLTKTLLFSKGGL
jgi:hypothetical protein